MVLPNAKLPESVLPVHILVRLDRCRSMLQNPLRWSIFCLAFSVFLSLMFANFIVKLPTGHWLWPVLVWIVPPIICFIAFWAFIFYSRASFIYAEAEYFRRGDISEEQWMDHCVSLEEREIYLTMTEPNALLYHQKHCALEESNMAMKAAADRELEEFRRSTMAKMAGEGRWMATYFDVPEWLY